MVVAQHLPLLLDVVLRWRIGEPAMSDEQKTDDLPTTKIPKPAASIADTEPQQSDRQFQDLLAKLPEPAKMVGPYELVRKLGKGGPVGKSAFPRYDRSSPTGC